MLVELHRRELQAVMPLADLSNVGIKMSVTFAYEIPDPLVPSGSREAPVIVLHTVDQLQAQLQAQLSPTLQVQVSPVQDDLPPMQDSQESDVVNLIIRISSSTVCIFSCDESPTAFMYQTGDKKIWFRAYVNVTPTTVHQATRKAAHDIPYGVEDSNGIMDVSFVGTEVHNSTWDYDHDLDIVTGVLTEDLHINCYLASDCIYYAPSTDLMTGKRSNYQITKDMIHTLDCLIKRVD